MQSTSYYLSTLKEELVTRQKKNPAYSLRSYAEFLGIHPGTLSSVFNGKRTLPVATAEKIATKLNLSPKEKHFFLKSLATEKARFKFLSEDEKEHQVYLDETHFQIIAEWEHYGIVTLMECHDFKSDANWIAQRLGLSVNRVEVALDRLLKANLIIKDDSGNYKKTFSKLKTTEDVFSPALQKAHLEELDLAREKMAKTQLNKRDYSSITLAMNMNNMEKAKAAIYEFRQKMRSILEEGEKTEVYELCIQLFPLTQLGETNL